MLIRVTFIQNPYINFRDTNFTIKKISWAEIGNFLGKTVTTTTANGISKTLTKDIPWKRLFASESLSALKEG